MLSEISKTEYKEALSVSDDNDFQIYYQRPPNSYFANNYFCTGIMALEANSSAAINKAVRDEFEKQLDNSN